MNGKNNQMFEDFQFLRQDYEQVPGHNNSVANVYTNAKYSGDDS
jgi:hypothetical protein